MPYQCLGMRGSCLETLEKNGLVVFISSTCLSFVPSEVLASLEEKYYTQLQLNDFTRFDKLANLEYVPWDAISDRTLKSNREFLVTLSAKHLDPLKNRLHTFVTTRELMAAFSSTARCRLIVNLIHFRFEALTGMSPACVSGLDPGVCRQFTRMHVDTLFKYGLFGDSARMLNLKIGLSSEDTSQARILEELHLSPRPVEDSFGNDTEEITIVSLPEKSLLPQSRVSPSSEQLHREKSVKFKEPVLKRGGSEGTPTRRPKESKEPNESNEQSRIRASSFENMFNDARSKWPSVTSPRTIDSLKLNLSQSKPPGTQTLPYDLDLQTPRSPPSKVESIEIGEGLGEKKPEKIETIPLPEKSNEPKKRNRSVSSTTPSSQHHSQKEGLTKVSLHEKTPKSPNLTTSHPTSKTTRRSKIPPLFNDSFPTESSRPFSPHTSGDTPPVSPIPLPLTNQSVVLSPRKSVVVTKVGSGSPRSPTSTDSKTIAKSPRTLKNIFSSSNKENVENLDAKKPPKNKQETDSK